MRITKTQLKQIIREELNELSEEMRPLREAEDPAWLDVRKILSVALREEELKGYGYIFKRAGKYPLDSLKSIAEQGDPMAPPEFNNGMRWAVEDIERWSETPESQPFTKWLGNSDRPWGDFR